jgi:hypothetical protein
VQAAEAAPIQVQIHGDHRHNRIVADTLEGYSHR